MATKKSEEETTASLTFETEFQKSEEPLACTKKSDALQLILATASGKPGHGCCFQQSDYCMVVPNRCFRKQVDTADNQRLPVFSALVSHIADLPKQEYWLPMEFDGQRVLFDKFSVQLTLGTGCVVKRWVPEGMEDTITDAEIPGFELHFVTSSEEEDDFIPMRAFATVLVCPYLIVCFAAAERIASIAETHRRQCIAAHNEITELHK
jgi:hypothetical protein